MDKKNENTEGLVDALLAKRRVGASTGFMPRFEAMLAAEKEAEAGLERMLKARNVAASSGFTDAVMRRIRVLKMERALKTVLPAFAAAASVALVFTVFAGSARRGADEARIYSELASLDSQMNSFEYFAQFSENYSPSKQAAIAAFLDDDSF